MSSVPQKQNLCVYRFRCCKQGAALQEHAPAAADRSCSRDRPTCLSPELAALIADAAVEHCTAGAAGSRGTSRALVCVADDGTADPRDFECSEPAHVAGGNDGSYHHIPRWAAASRQPPAASWHDGQPGGNGSSQAVESCVRWSAATASTLGMLPAASSRPQQRPVPSRPPPDIPRIKFPSTKAGKQVQRRCITSSGAWMAMQNSFCLAQPCVILVWQEHSRARPAEDL